MTNPTPNTEADAAEIRRSLTMFCQQGAVYELRALGTPKGTQNGYFDDLDKMARAASLLSGRSKGVYFSENPVDPALLARANNRVRQYVKQGEATKDAEIICRRIFSIDFDPARPAGISSTEDEHQAAIARAYQCRDWLSDLGFPDPAVCNSGNGAHLIYRIDLPNDDASRQLLARCLKALASQFNDAIVVVDPTTFNASRIWKLYGTLVCKGDPTPDRPHRLSAILGTPDQLELVPPELLRRLADIAPQPGKSEPKTRGRAKSPPAGATGDYTTLDVVSWFQSHDHYGGDMGGGKHAVLCPWAGEHSEQRPATDGDSVVWEATNGKWPGFHCSHAHCVNRLIQDVLSLWGDADSFCSQGYRRTKGGARAESKPGQQTESALPQVMVSDRHMREISEEAWQILTAANTPPFLFQRGHLLVDIIMDDKGQPVLRTLDRAGFKGILDRVADFVEAAKDGEQPARPPADVVADMMAAKELALPVLEGIIQAPIFTPSGDLDTNPGYQLETRCYLHLAKGLYIPEVPLFPSGADLESARSLILDELLGDFRFVGDADLAHAVAILLLPFVRLMIDGPTPLHLVESPTPGSGKGLLVDVLTIPAAGRGPSVMTEGRDEDEWRKRLTAKLLSAPQFILIDNVRSRLDSAALSAALTSETWEDRILGQSRTAALPVTCVWLATANNPSLSLEVARRTLSIRLDSGVEKPWLRKGFKHPKLRRWARQNRARLIWAALTLIQTWIAAGKPAGQQTMGGYETFGEVMGGILEVVGIPGFLGNADRVYAEADRETSAWAEFCQGWWDEYQDKRVGTDLLFEMATRNRWLLDIWGGRNDHSGRTRFGVALSKMRDRIVGEFRIQRADPDTHDKVQRYRLVELRGVRGVAGASASQKYSSAANEGTPESAPAESAGQPHNFGVADPPQGPATPRNEDQSKPASNSDEDALEL